MNETGITRLYRRPLRLVVMSLVIILVSITWTAETREVIRWYGAFTLAKDTLRVNSEVDALLQAGQNLAFERGRTNVLLNASGKPSSANLAFITERREATSKNLDHLLDDPDLCSFPLFSRIKEKYSSLTQLRARVDSALEQDAVSRPAGLSSLWFSETTSLVNDLAEMSALISLMDDKFNVSFRSLSRLKILAFDLRNALGTEASRIAAATQSSGTPQSTDIDRILLLRGQSTAIWDSLRRESRVSGNAVASASVESIEREFFITFRPLEDEALAALTSRRDGKPASLDVSRLTSASVPALDSIAKALSGLTDESARITAIQFSRAWNSLSWAIAMAVLALIAGILALHTVTFRLFAPLRELGTELERLAGGDASERATRYKRKDELGRAYEIVAIFRASLIKRKELEERLLVLSNSDGLTGLANRRRLDMVLDVEWKRATREGTRLALVMFDVDLFKSYNDTYGHLAGDEVLKAIALVIEANTRRPGDLSARYGGEEFVAILPGLSVSEAEIWANCVRQAVSALALAHELSPTGVVTISAGVTATTGAADTAHVPAGTAQEMLKRADAALYAAKNGGRNQVRS